MFKHATDCFLTIDLAPECVRVLDVTMRRGALSIESLASELLPEGDPTNLPARHMETFARMLHQHHLRSRRCVGCVPTNLVTTRAVIVDPAKPLLPDDQIKQTLQAILSFDARDLLFDYWNVTYPDAKNRTYEVLVVAAQRSVVHRYLEGFRRLGLSCSHLDVAPCALASLIARLLPQQESMIGTVALGETLGYFAMVEKQQVLFWRPFDMPPAKNGPQWARERIGDEVSKCVSHMLGAQHMDNLAEIVLVGKNAQDPAFGGHLASRFNVQVRTPSPFASLGANALSSAANAALQASAATDFAVALGLAWQGAGGNHG